MSAKADGLSQTGRGDRSRIAFGRQGEDVAVAYLQSLGMRILDRNWRSRVGELDVVALDLDTIVVCEVKTRSGDRYGGPLDAVPGRKLARIRCLAGEWLACHPQHAVRVRIDLIGILIPRVGAPSLLHLRGV